MLPFFKTSGENYFTSTESPVAQTAAHLIGESPLSIEVKLSSCLRPPKDSPRCFWHETQFLYHNSCRRVRVVPLHQAEPPRSSWSIELSPPKFRAQSERSCLGGFFKVNGIGNVVSGRYTSLAGGRRLIRRVGCFDETHHRALRSDRFRSLRR